MKKIKGITDCKITYKAETIGTAKDFEGLNLEELKEKIIKEVIISLGLNDEEVVNYKIDIDFSFEDVED